MKKYRTISWRFQIKFCFMPREKTWGIVKCIHMSTGCFNLGSEAKIFNLVILSRFSLNKIFTF